MTHYTGYAEYRRISPMLWLGLLTVPWLSVWFLLRNGHSPRSRIIGFGLVGIAVACAVFSPKTEVAPQTPVATVVAEQKPLSAEEVDAAKREKLSQADRALNTAKVRDGESREAFNARVTGLYEAWVAAQIDYNGEDWESDIQSGINEAYLNCRRHMNSLGISDGGMFDLSNFNTPADRACQRRGIQMQPYVPQLVNYLIPSPDDVESTEPVKSPTTDEPSAAPEEEG